MGEQQQEWKGQRARSDRTSGRSSVADKPTNDEEDVPRGVTQKNRAQRMKPETELKTYMSGRAGITGEQRYRKRKTMHCSVYRGRTTHGD